MEWFYMKKFDNFCKALNNLEEGTKLTEPYSVVEQAGIAGLFEICFEQSWKLMKEVLEQHGRFDEKIGSPRSIIKIAYQSGMIDNRATSGSACLNPVIFSPTRTAMQNRLQSYGRSIQTISPFLKTLKQRSRITGCLD